MADLIGLMIATFIISSIGMGGGFWFYNKIKPKKMTWNAKVYQVGEGIKPYKRDKEGNVIHKIKLCELKPYTTDIIEKDEINHGIVEYRLKKLGKVCNPISNDVVEYWGEKNKQVSVVLIDDQPVLMTKGYDKTTEELIYETIPTDKMFMISSQIASRKARKKSKKDILEAITPWVIAGLMMLACFGIAYISFTSLEKMNEQQAEVTKYYADKQLEITQMFEQIQNKKIVTIQPNELGVQNTTKPPSITG